MKATAPTLRPAAPEFSTPPGPGWRTDRLQP